MPAFHPPASHRAAEYFSYNLPVRIVSIGVLLLLVVAAVSAQTITGVVVDASSAAIPGARVSLVGPGQPAAQTISNLEGRFSISGILTSRSKLTVQSNGFAPFERSLANDGVQDFTIVLQPAAVSADVTVSITGTETRLSETPASVVVIGRDTLESTASPNIDDALRHIAGFTLFRRSSSRTANPTTHGANLRGVSGSGASRAAVMFDGLSLNDAFGGWTYWTRVPQIAIERVEVLRGGASSIYGTGGLSGAVNLVRTNPTKDGVIRAEVSAGTQDTYDGSFFSAVSRGGWQLDLAAEAFTTGGYIPITEEERGLVDRRADSKRRNAMFGLGRRFNYRTSNVRVFVRGNLFSEDRQNGTSLTNNATYFRQAAMGGDIVSEAVGRVEVRAFVQAQVYDQTFSSVSANRNTEALTRLQRVPSQAVGANIFWTRAFRQHTIASSFELRDVSGFSDEVGFANGISTSVGRTGGRERTYAFFLQELWRINKRVTLSIGARYDRWRNYDSLSESRSLATGVVTQTFFADRQQNTFSPRVAALVTATDSLSFYGAYSRSFRAPTLNELYRGFRVGNVVTQANENLRAEFADTFEAGLSSTHFERRFTVRGNVFVTTVTDPVVSITLSSTPALITRQRQNVGETRSRGIELDAEFRPFPKLRMSAGYLFVDARVTEFPSNTALVGKLLPQVARQQLTMQFNYRPLTRWSIGMQARASSFQFEDEVNLLRLRPYFTADFTTAIHVWRGVEIFAAVENIFNSRYDVGLTPNRSVASPSFARLGLRFDFSKR